MLVPEWVLVGRVSCIVVMGAGNFVQGRMPGTRPAGMQRL